MSFFSLLYQLLFGPLELLFDAVYAFMFRVTKNEGVAIVALSLAINFLILPLYRRADAMQEEERVRTQKLERVVSHIKKVFKGDERFMILQTYYRQNDYKPYYALKGSMSLLLEIPFFIAAFNFLSELDILVGASFGPIRDLGLPDGMLHIGGYSVNVLPVLMTLINIVSGYIYTRGMPLKSKIQLYGMALIFLVLLYSSPAGLVFYWTLNNLFSLVKNVFYKLKNPKLVLLALFAAAGCGGMLFLLVRPMRTTRMQIFFLIGMLALMAPLAVYLLARKHHFSLKVPEASKTDNLIFFICGVLLTVLTGILIPSAVIGSSPAEFVDVTDFHSPLRYVLASFALAAGTFLIWTNVFYYLSSPAVRRFFCFGAVILSGAAVVDYMFFGKDYGNMSPMLQYDSALYSVSSDYLVNSLIIAALGALLAFILSRRPVIIQSVGAVVCVALVIMSGMNLFSIQSKVKAMSQSVSDISQNERISIPLDKKEKNVIVIMLDRGINDFIPYIMEEKPELRKQFAGFTYYPNTISYGNCTTIASAGLYGGYDYIPEQSAKRDTVTVTQKQNEALCVMPDTFADNGYEVTVCDPTFAGLHWLPDLGIYSDHPSIQTFITKNSFADGYSPEALNKLLNRNFFAYSIFRSSPVLFHQTFYNKGLYNHSAKTKGLQVTEDIYRASGGFNGASPLFTGSYSVLKNLPSITDVRDGGNGTFLMISNDTAHDVVMLQEPDYVPENEIDNSAFEENPPVRTAADGSQLVFSTPLQLAHYQCNMAAMLKIGEWLDYLRENGVYDNTRIIIVSDHGRHIDYLGNMRFQDGKKRKPSSKDDVMSYKALLLVKDFNSVGFTTDETFMTNADTPSIAFSGLIENPVNPFTGHPITMEGKNVPEHHIASTLVWSIDDYRGDEKNYLGITWIGLKGGNTYDLSAWRVIGETLSESSDSKDQ